MVHIGIPNNYTASPTDLHGTPSLNRSINHQVALDLDSSNAFEGPEKLLEVWFSPSPHDLLECSEPTGLKAVPSDVWKSMLDLVNCKVLSTIESEDVDAYLLSESSMFVFPHKLILKTCGTTTLLWGLPRILEIATLFGGFPRNTAPPNPGIMVAAAPYRVFYSRKNFLFPDRQKGPHRSWRDEVRTLDKLFLRGSAYMIGKMNGEHWYLYLTEPFTMLTPPASPQSMDMPETETKLIDLPSSLVSDRAAKVCEGEDETLEVLMTDLDEENAKQFYLDEASAVAEERYNSGQSDKDDTVDVFSNASDATEQSSNAAYPVELTTEGHALGTVVSDTSGLSDVYPKSKYPDARIDAYLFTPCGFSANGVIPAPPGERGTNYFTVHVTPEPQCSYASFETNVPCGQSGRDTQEIVQHAVNIFKPGRFSVTLFEAKTNYEELEGANDATVAKIEALQRHNKTRGAKMDSIKGYRRIDRIVHDLDGYDLVFRYYERNDWKGGAPRIGEALF